MSKFIDAIQEQMTGRLRDKCTPFSFEPLRAAEWIVPANPDSPPYNRQGEYKFKVIYEMSAFATSREVPYLRANFIRQLREAIYGDMKQNLIRLERAIYERDTEAAEREIRDMLKEMFG
jgi:hypothetical protein